MTPAATVSSVGCIGGYGGRAVLSPLWRGLLGYDLAFDTFAGYGFLLLADKRFFLFRLFLLGAVDIDRRQPYTLEAQRSAFVHPEQPDAAHVGRIVLHIELLECVPRRYSPFSAR